MKKEQFSVIREPQVAFDRVSASRVRCFIRVDRILGSTVATKPTMGKQKRTSLGA
jgi:hypothetical protein